MSRKVVWAAIAVSAGCLAGAAVASASDLGTFVDLTNALRGIAESSSRKSLAPAAPEQVLPDFTLVGVIIAGDKRLALVQPAATTSTGPELLPIGGVLAGYRLTDVAEQQVTFEGQHGERRILRLQAGGSLAR